MILHCLSKKTFSTMKIVVTLLSALLVVGCMVSTGAFMTPTAFSRVVASKTTTTLSMGLLGGDDEPKVLTRDNEPEDYFST
jgi:hypothetical protein